MLLTANFGLQEENINIRRERPLINKTGWGSPTKEREERPRDRKREKEGGSEDAVLCEKGG